MWNTWGRICIGFVLMTVRTRWWISIKMDIRIQIGIKTMPLINTGILAYKKLFHQICSLKTNVHIPKRKLFVFASQKPQKKGAGSGSIIQVYGSSYSDLYKTVTGTDQKHVLKLLSLTAGSNQTLEGVFRICNV
jgi:hypothetical protein